MDIFKKLFSALEQESVQYMVAGGIAVNLYGIERATADIDVALKLEKDNLSKFFRVTKKLGLKPKAPVKLEDFAEPAQRESWAKDKGMVVFSLFDPRNPYFLLDIFTEMPFDFDKVYKIRKRIKFEETVVDVVPINELIKMKVHSDRPQDEADVFYLKKIMEDLSDGE